MWTGEDCMRLYVHVLRTLAGGKARYIPAPQRFQCMMSTSTFTNFWPRSDVDKNVFAGTIPQRRWSTSASLKLLPETELAPCIPPEAPCTVPPSENCPGVASPHLGALSAPVMTSDEEATGFKEVTVKRKLSLDLAFLEATRAQLWLLSHRWQ